MQCAVIVGGVDIMQQSIALARKPHVIVATPGRMIDHLENTKGFTLSSIRHLIMDEADRMLSMDFEEEYVLAAVVVVVVVVDWCWSRFRTWFFIASHHRSSDLVAVRVTQLSILNRVQNQSHPPGSAWFCSGSPY